jgi:hypothetical protein
METVVRRSYIEIASEREEHHFEICRICGSEGLPMIDRHRLILAGVPLLVAPVPGWLGVAIRIWVVQDSARTSVVPPYAAWDSRLRGKFLGLS